VVRLAGIGARRAEEELCEPRRARRKTERTQRMNCSAAWSSLRPSRPLPQNAVLNRAPIRSTDSPRSSKEVLSGKSGTDRVAPVAPALSRINPNFPIDVDCSDNWLRSVTSFWAAGWVAVRPVSFRCREIKTYLSRGVRGKGGATRGQSGIARTKRSYFCFSPRPSAPLRGCCRSPRCWPLRGTTPVTTCKLRSRKNKAARKAE
jgi:hypothetical protein